MSVKILLIGARLCRNLGGPSLLVTVRMVLDKFIADAEYTFVSPTAEDLGLTETYNVKIVPGSFIRTMPSFLAAAVLDISAGSGRKRDLVNAFTHADIIIDISGIIFCDSLLNNQFITRANEGLHLFLGKVFRKPVVKYTADIGPFESRWNRYFAKFYMQHFVDLILARNDLTRQRLRALGVSTPTIVCPDTAFLLPAHKSPFSEAISRQKANYPIVGFSMSHQAVWQSHGSEIYLDTMASLADYIVDKLNAKILLIPNELSGRSAYDDVFVANEIRRRMSNPGKTIISSDENNAWEMKGIIGQCDVLVASRYHSVISGLSQGIPVLAVGWHDKYPEVLRLVGQDRHLCSIKTLDFNDLRDKFDLLWQQRHQITSEINAALPLIRENIFNGGKAVGRLLKEKHGSA